MLLVPALLLAVLPVTWIVDAANGPGTNFTDLPAAVAAASTGDTIIVRPGTYTHFLLDGKSLTIRGAGSMTTVVSLLPPGPYPHTTIQNVPPGTHCYLAGLTLTTPSSTVSGLRVLGPSSVVTLADCVVGGGASVAPFGTTGMEVSDGARVHATRCTFLGGGITWLGGAGAVVYTGAALVADASTFQGGSSSILLGPSVGGVGLLVQLQGFASLSRSTVRGGNATLGTSSGGTGLRVTGGGAFARVAGTSLDVVVGGMGSAPAFGGYAAIADLGGIILVNGAVSIQAAAPGGPVTSGLVTTGGVPLPYLSVTGTSAGAGEIMAAQPATVTFDGAIPFAPFACVVNVAPGFSTAIAPVTIGPLVVELQGSIFLEGNLDAAGMHGIVFTPAVHIPALTNVPLYAQFGVLDLITGTVRVSNGSIRLFKN